MPRAEVLRGCLHTDAITEVGVHVAGAHGHEATVVALVDEQAPAAAAPRVERAEHPQGIGIADVVRALGAALASVVEHRAGPADPDVVPPDRGESERAVVPRVGVRPDPERRRVQQPDRAREDALAGEAPARQVVGDLRPEVRQALREDLDPAELLGRSPLVPPVVVAVLRASCRVDADRLDVSRRGRGRSTRRSTRAGSPARRSARGWPRRGSDRRDRRRSGNPGPAPGGGRRGRAAGSAGAGSRPRLGREREGARRLRRRAPPILPHPRSAHQPLSA